MFLWFILLGYASLVYFVGLCSSVYFIGLCFSGYFCYVVFQWLFVIGCHSLVKFNLLCFWLFLLDRVLLILLGRVLLILLDRVLLILLGRVWFSLMGYFSLFSIYKTINTEKLNLKWKEIKS